MGNYRFAEWSPRDASIGLPRVEREGGRFRAYVPDPLAGLAVVASPSTFADVADAERALARLDAAPGKLPNTEGLARLLLRAESVSSSYIEGLEIGPKRLLRAASDAAQGLPIVDQTAAAVLANIAAMEFAVSAVSEANPITLDLLLETHRQLLSQSDLHNHAGKLRDQQNWIGGSSLSPMRAAFVPPPPTEVPRLMGDLVDFCNEDTNSALVQAAVAHAQFENIHPFVDGNGRVGRALVHMVLRRRGLALRCTPPISLILATRAQDYVFALRASAYEGAPTSDRIRAAYEPILILFASATTIATQQSSAFEDQIASIQAEWRARLGPVRADSAVLELLEKLPATPVLTAREAQTLTSRTFASANNAIAQLVHARILKPTTDARRNRVYEASDIIDAFASLERQLASPDLDTKISRPVRRVPHRRR